MKIIMKIYVFMKMNILEMGYIIVRGELVL